MKWKIVKYFYNLNIKIENFYFTTYQKFRLIFVGGLTLYQYLSMKLIDEEISNYKT